jgi:glycosyltransferase involved in cell wall biosynthesis
MPRVLFVSYTFPPVGGAGVQRLTKWLKYLPRHGWQASVLTTENASVPLTDGSLARDVPAETRVVRARTLEPSYQAKAAVLKQAERPRRSVGAGLRSAARSVANLALQPDPQVLWAPAALRAGRHLLSEVPHDVVVATAPPFSTLLVGARLARAAGLPLVLDYRDEWDISSRYWENRPRDAVSRWVQARMQANALRRAQLVVATTQRSTTRLAEKCRVVGSEARTRCIYNGYDAEDFDEALSPRASREAYRLVYLGTLWALTDATPLVEGVVRLAAESPGQAKSLEIVFAGRRTAEQSAVLARLEGLPCRVGVLDYVEHAQAVRMMREASGLCLLLSGLPAAERVVPAKLFEYMAARRPILGVLPDGECRDLLEGHPAAIVCDPREPGSVARALSQEIARAASGREPEWGSWDPSRYSRTHLTAELAEALDTVATACRKERA